MSSFFSAASMIRMFTWCGITSARSDGWNPGALELLAHEVAELLHRELEDLVAAHLEEVVARLRRLRRSPAAASRTAGTIMVSAPVPSAPISPSRILPWPGKRREDGGAGGVAEQDARRAVLVVHDAAHALGADRRARGSNWPLATSDRAVKSAVTKPEQAAFRSNAAALREAERALHEARGRRDEVVGRHRRDDDEVDVRRRDLRRPRARGGPPRCTGPRSLRPAAAMRRSRIPVRVKIHSSLVSTIFSRSAFERTRDGT